MFARSGTTLRLSDIPNGCWTWVERGHRRATPRLGWFGQEDNNALASLRVMMSSLRVHDATVSFSRREIGSGVPGRITVSACGSEALVSVPQMGQLLVYDGCAAAREKSTDESRGCGHCERRVAGVLARGHVQCGFPCLADVPSTVLPRRRAVSLDQSMSPPSATGRNLSPLFPLSHSMSKRLWCIC